MLLLPVLAVPNDVPPKGELLKLPKVVSFSVLAFKSVVSAPEDDTAETEFDGATEVDPNLKIGAAGNEGAATEVETLLFNEVVKVLPLLLMVAVVEEATLEKQLVTV